MLESPADSPARASAPQMVRDWGRIQGAIENRLLVEWKYEKRRHQLEDRGLSVEKRSERLRRYVARLDRAVEAERETLPGKPGHRPAHEAWAMADFVLSRLPDCGHDWEVDWLVRKLATAERELALTEARAPQRRGGVARVSRVRAERARHIAEWRLMVEASPDDPPRKSEAARWIAQDCNRQGKGCSVATVRRHLRGV